ncbi:LEAF RUST 10 DISEASE-RESISTANCE LOCUS RECEPTOR-LIKE PROTEIN KINASE-like 2.7 [Lolium rigidum]|uniref:LEAF RUST 10 DISEASE-RESISTANCE LOCUS RECEPTOR-LIKE PROTEIN KINASE-like 2.7 n=1 Tax=Lolium rigidum TaxID=89674 RepID=UPI001F5E005E|nr:LEAF RUST 10 DISEASE-RESISTANCE LOCUS RECEPTOR-LIKE PROTEIN KINASE-like 2.7 [Lolium rigidum]
MAHPLRLLVFVFLVVHASPLPLSTYDDSMCSESFRCGDVDIAYPFFLSNATQVSPDYTSNYSCGYTDLKIFCEGEGNAMAPILHLGGDRYTIVNISYDKHTFILGDTDVLRGNNCPRVSHDVSLGQAWLGYTDSLSSLAFFFDCYDAGEVLPPDLKDHQINCTGFSGDGVSFVFVAGYEERNVSQKYDLAGHCNHSFVVPVHEDPLLGSGQQLMLPAEYGGVLKKGFELEWNQGAEQVCNLCEQSDGRCSYSENKQFLGCLCTGGKVGVQDCNGGGATPASAEPSSSKFS